MKPSCYELQLKAKHSAYVYLDQNYSKSSKETFAKRSTMKSPFITQSVSVKCKKTLEASYFLLFLCLLLNVKKSCKVRGFN